MDQKKNRTGYMTKSLLLGVVGLICGTVIAHLTIQDLKWQTVPEPVIWISRVVLLALILTSFHLMRVAKKSDVIYKTRELEEEVADRTYQMTFRSLEYASIGFNIAQVFAILHLFLGLQIAVLENGMTIHFSMIDIVAILLVLFFQRQLYDLISQIREYRLSIFSMPQEIKDYIYSFDESEKDSIFEHSFLTLFQLNQIVLPALYLLLFLLSFAMGEVQFVGFLVVAFIHIYINVKQYKQVTSYYK